MEVTRVGRSAPWVDIRCFTWAVSWTKRMPAGLPPTLTRDDWTPEEIAATEPDWSEVTP